MGAIELGDPGALWLLLPIPLVVVAVRRFAPRRGGRHVASLVLRALVLALLVLALARPSHVDRVDALAVAFVVDVSESVPLAARDRALARIEREIEEMPPGDDASLIVFGERASVEVPFGATRAATGDARVVPRLDHLESRVHRAQSDLARALELAERTFPSGAARRVVLVSDGNQTRGDVRQAARALKAAGVRLDVRPIAYRFEEEVLAEGLFAAPRGRVEEPLQLRFVVSAQVRTPAEVTLLEDGLPVGDPMPVELDPGTNVFRFSTVPSAPGYRAYEARVRAERDGSPANDVARAGVLVGAGARVLVVAPAGSDERLRSALAELELAVEGARPNEMPRHPAGYVDVDAVVLDGVPAYDLDPVQLAALRDAVVELGAGLVVVGGARTFGPGGAKGTALEELLPVDLDVRNRKSLPKGALVIVLHSIEFDSGNTWAARICKSALRGLHPTDEAGVVYYDGMGGERWLFDLSPVGSGVRMGALVDSVFVGDMPSFHRCFVLAEQSLARSDAAVKHVVVISDGDPQIPDPGLLGRLVADRVTISTICIEPHGPGSVGTMQELARIGGGRFRQLFPSRGDLSQLPRLMLKEAATLRRSAIKEEPFVPLVALPGSALLAGVDRFPTLRGYVVTSPREGAETILVADDEEGDPLLAAWYRGLGRVVAFTSDAGSRWAGEWLSWERFAPFWAQVVRSTVLTAGTDDHALEVTTDGLELDVVLDAQDGGGAPILDLELEGVALAGEGDPVRFVPRQVEAGRYRAQVPVAAPGTYLVRVRGEGVRSTAVAAIDYAPEYRSLRSREELLAAAAAENGGRVHGPTDRAFVHDLAAERGRVELWRAALLLAAILLVLEVALRRLDLDFGRVGRAAHAVVRPARAAAAAVARATARARTERAPRSPPDETILGTEATDDGPGGPDEPKSPSAAPPDPGPIDAETLSELRKAKERAKKRREWN